MNERRSSRRWNTFLNGRIVFNNRCSVLSCTVRDLSETGARISFADVSALPEEFELEIPNRGMRVYGRLMWSRGATHGVMFFDKLRPWMDPLRTVAA
ncbi:PilZ domain-containing protein [Microvirga aerilata]|uniref:PilZ domain-containing protein n=1 Tax=Microvirga aerilata TaxID=670292 RepID=A0A936ZKI0_9HYPH|nr:PilZ domain-containing protein [Microvirga aerilata]MBL0406313.1 PilZ domain-containing protein [Microvirga aerilata]